MEGNTEGKLVNEPKPNTASGNSNPPEPSSGLIHQILDVAGAIPIIGALFDAINGGIYAAEGDAVNSAISFSSAALDFVPGVGTAAKGIKIAYKVGKSVAGSAIKATEKTAIKQAAKTTAKQAEKTAAKQVEKAAAKKGEKSSAQSSSKNVAKKEDGIAAKDKKKSDPIKECPGVGHPVNPILGIKVLSGETELDFVLPSVLPLSWQRSYFSDQLGNGWLGQGWSLPFSCRLLHQAGSMLLIDSQGRESELPQLKEGQCKFDRYERIFFAREHNGRYRVSTVDHQVHYIFSPLALGENDRQGAMSSYLPLNAIEDAHGNRIRLFYNDEGLPIYIHDAAQRRLALQFMQVALADGSQAHRLQSVTHLHEQIDGQGKNCAQQTEILVSYCYSAEGDLIRVHNAEGNTRREYRYTQHILTEHSRPGGLITRYEYDAYTLNGKVVRHTTNLGQSWQFDYRDGETWVTDPLGRVIRYQYNADKKFTGMIDARGGESKNTLDNLGRIVALTAPDGQQTHYAYNNYGQIMAITNAVGQRVAIQYDAQSHRPVAVTDVMGHTTRYDYDAAGNAVRMVNAHGHPTEYSYDSRGLLTKITSCDGKARSLEYNSAGLLIAYTDCSNLTVRLARNAKGQVTAITYPDDTQTTFTYNEQGNLLKKTFANGSSEHYLYDALGRKIGQRDGLGAQTSWELDFDGLPLKRINACGNSFYYQYDNARRLISLTNENGMNHHFIYDESDNIICEQGFDRTVTRYQYDNNGRLVEKRELGTQTVLPTNALEENLLSEIKTTFFRDPLGRVVENIIQHSSSNTTVHSYYQYNAAGLLIQARNAHSVIERGYDKLGQLMFETCDAMGQQQTLRHAYHCNGKRSHTIFPNGSQLNYLYYGNGHLHQINIDGEILCDIERDSMHREIYRTQGGLISHFQYSTVGQRIDQQALAQAYPTYSPSPVISRRYQYDKTGNLQNIIDLHGGNIRHQYDPLGRLIKYDETCFLFDPANNLIDPDILSNNTLDNRLASYRNHRYIYDTYGNLREKTTSTHNHLHFYYTPEHQIEYIEAERDGETQVTYYYYDALGRRICKKGMSNTTFFFWDGERLLRECGTQYSITYLYEPESFIPLAQIVQKGVKDKKIYYYHTDQIGMPRELTSVDGQIVWQARYHAWGKMLMQNTPAQRQSDTELIHQPLRFQGQYYDAESGLHYNRYRYYDPDIGRFITKDPVGLNGGNNSYQYAPNPTGWIDPMGLVKEHTGFVYRALKPEEFVEAMMGNSILAADPNANFSHKAHVGGPVATGGDHLGGQGQKTQFISTTKSLHRARCYDAGKDQIIRIDLSRIPDNAIKDISNGHGLKGIANHWAREDKEVLIIGRIPSGSYEMV